MSSPEASSLSWPTGDTAGGPAGPRAPGAACLYCTGEVGAGEHSVCAAAVVTVDTMLTACSPALPECIYTVTLPQLHTHPVLQQLTYMQTCLLITSLTTHTDGFQGLYQCYHSKNILKDPYNICFTGNCVLLIILILIYNYK